MRKQNDSKQQDNGGENYKTQTSKFKLSQTTDFSDYLAEHLQDLLTSTVFFFKNNKISRSKRDETLKPMTMSTVEKNGWMAHLEISLTDKRGTAVYILKFDCDLSLTFAGGNSVYIFRTLLEEDDLILVVQKIPLSKH